MVKATRFTPSAPRFAGTAAQGRGVVDASGLAQGLGALNEALLAERARADHIDLTRRITDFGVQTSKRFDEAASGYDGSTDGFATSRLADFDARAKAMLDAAPERLRERLSLEVARRRGEEELAATRYEISQTRQFALNGANASILAARNAILSDPAQYEAQRGLLPQVAEAVPAAMRAAWLAEQESELAAAYGDGLLEKDPQRLIDAHREGVLDGLIKPDDKRRQIAAAEAELKRRKAEAEAKAREERLVRGVELRALMDDDIAAVATTGKGVEGLDAGEVAKVLGPDDLKRWEIARDNARAAYAAVAGFENMSASEIGERLSALKPGDSDRTSGFAARKEVYEMAARTAEAHLRARVKDPAQYYLDQDKEAGALYEAASQAAGEGLAVAPALFERYARRIEAKQRQGGVAQPKLLPGSVAKELVAAIDEAPQGQRAQAMRDLILRLDVQYGDRADQVFDQLLDEKLPQETRVLRALAHDPARMGLVARAIDARDDVEKIVDQKTRNAAAEQLSSELEPLIDSFAAYPDGAELAAIYQDTLGTTAAYLISREKLSPSKAAQKAASLIAGDYNFISTFRVPIEHDAKTVAYGASLALDEAIAGDGRNLAAPVFHESLPNADNQKLYAEHLAKHGRWVTASGDDGLILIDENGNAVRNIEGEVIKKSFTELVTAGKSMAKQRREHGFVRLLTDLD